MKLPYLRALALACLLAGCHRPAASPLPDPAVAVSVNGEKVLSDELFAALRLESGPKVLERLVAERAILQEARKQKIEVSESELAQVMPRPEAYNNDPVVRELLERTRKSEILLRKLILARITPAIREAFYKANKDLLTQYDVMDIICPDELAAEGCLSRLTSKVHMFKFEEVASTSSLDERTRKQGGHIGLLTMPAIQEALGSQVAGIIARLAKKMTRDGALSDPIPLIHGQFLILKVARVNQSYEEVRTLLEDIMVEADKPEYLFDLLQATRIWSPYKAGSPPVPEPEPSPTSSPRS